MFSIQPDTLVNRILGHISMSEKVQFYRPESELLKPQHL